MQVGVRNMWQMYVLSDSFLHFYSSQAGHSPAAPLRVPSYSHISMCKKLEAQPVLGAAYKFNVKS